MMLGDHGARVVRVAPLWAEPIPPAFDMTLRSRAEVVRVDLKSPGGVAAARALVAEADALIEGFRPGVMERLGLGPEPLIAANPRLVYGRLTGYGQHGPMADTVGHDIGFLALSGALSLYGPADAPPSPPINAVADMGGGGMLLAFGLLAAILSARATGRGQVVDAAMIDGAGLLHATMWSLRAAGQWGEGRGANLLDGGAPFYRCYACADGGHVAVGALEPRFFAALLAGLGLADAPECAAQYDRARWPAMAAAFAARFASAPRGEWAARFTNTEACVVPVLTPAEAAGHPHAVARAGHVTAGGVLQPAPAPRFSATPAATPAMARG